MKNRFILILSMFVFINSCTQESTCIEPQLVSLKGGFYYMDSLNVMKDSALQNANLWFGSTTNYFQNLTQKSKFSFPLSQLKDTASIVFQSDSTDTNPNTFDTFQLVYTRELHFISAACGYQNNFTLISTAHTNHFIDSVIIATPQITNDVNKEHIKIVIKK